MRLKEYLVKNNMQMQEFADFVGISRSHLYLISQGRRRPGKALIRLINMATMGTVNEEDFKPRIETKEGL